MTELDFQKILEIIYQLLPIIILLLGAKPAQRWLGKQKAAQIMGISQIAYMAIENMKRQHRKKTNEPMGINETQKLFERAIKQELRANGIKPTPKIISQAKIYAEAKHAAVKGIK